MIWAWPRACRHTSRGTMVAARKVDAGFTLTEMMVVVVILSLLAALSTPLFTSDNKARKGRAWSDIIAQTLQRARFQAMGDRTPIHVLFYRTRIDTWAEIPPVPPATDPTFTLLSQLAAPWPDGDRTVAIWDARSTGPGDPPTAQNTSQIDTTVKPGGSTVKALREIVFTSLGSTTGNANWRVYIRNELLPRIHPDASFVVNVGGLTGFVSANDRWALPPGVEP